MAQPSWNTTLPQTVGRQKWHTLAHTIEQDADGQVVADGWALFTTTDGSYLDRPPAVSHYISTKHSKHPLFLGNWGKGRGATFALRRSCCCNTSLHTASQWWALALHHKRLKDKSPCPNHHPTSDFRDKGILANAHHQPSLSPNSNTSANPFLIDIGGEAEIR